MESTWRMLSNIPSITLVQLFAYTIRQYILKCEYLEGKNYFLQTMVKKPTNWQSIPLNHVPRMCHECDAESLTWKLIYVFLFFSGIGMKMIVLWSKADLFNTISKTSGTNYPNYRLWLLSLFTMPKSQRGTVVGPV